MSKEQSQQARDEYRRELEREANRLEMEYNKAQSQFQEQQQSWHKKIQELDKDKTKVEEKIRGFEAFVENLRAASREVDDDRVKATTQRLQDELLDLKAKRAELMAQAETDLRPYSEKTQDARKAMEKAKEAVLGAQIYDAMLKEEPKAPEA